MFVGNSTSSEYLLNHIVEPQNELIRGRFFTKAYQYYGIRTKSEMKLILKCFDSRICHAGEITSITSYFVDTKNSKWKLSSLSNDIWSVFKDEYMKPLNLESWGMQYFLSTIKTLLVDFIPNSDISDKEYVRNMIRKSIQLSGLEPDLVKVA